MDVVLVGLPGSGKTRRRATAGQPPRRVVHRPRRADRGGRRPLDPGDLRRGRRGGVPGARTGGHRRPRPGRPGARGPARDRDGRRRGRRSAQPLGALPRADDGLARRPARRSSPSGCAARRTSGRSSPAATRSGRCATWPPGASGSTARPTSTSRGVAEVHGVVDAVEAQLGADRTRDGAGRRCSRTATPIGRFVLGDGIAADALGDRARRACGARRAILVSEPGAWAAVGERLAAASARTRPRGRPRPAARRARRPSDSTVVEDAARELAGLRVERSRAARRGRWRRARRHGRLPRRGLPARRPDHPGADDAGRPDRLGDRRQDRGRPARGQEPRRGLPPAERDHHRHRDAADAPRATDAGRARRGGQDGGTRRRAAVRTARGRRAGHRARRRGGLRRRASSPSSSSGPAGPRSRWSSPTSASAVRRPAGSRSTSGTRSGHAFEAAGRLRRAAPRRGRRLRAAGGVPDRRRGRVSRRRSGRRGSSGCSTRSGSATEPLPYPLATVDGPPRRPTRSTPTAGSAGSCPTADGVVVRDDIDPALVERAAAGLLAAPSGSPR